MLALGDFFRGFQVLLYSFLCSFVFSNVYKQIIIITEKSQRLRKNDKKISEKLCSLGCFHSLKCLMREIMALLHLPQFSAALCLFCCNFWCFGNVYCVAVTQNAEFFAFLRFGYIFHIIKLHVAKSQRRIMKEVNNGSYIKRNLQDLYWRLKNKTFFHDLHAQDHFSSNFI